MNVIVFTRPDGGTSVISPAPGVSLEDAARAVPHGVPFQIVDAASIPADPAPVPERAPVLALLNAIDEVSGLDSAVILEALDAKRRYKLLAARYLRRDQDEIAGFAQAFGLTSTQVDNLFRRAVELDAAADNT